MLQVQQAHLASEGEGHSELRWKHRLTFRLASTVKYGVQFYADTNSETPVTFFILCGSAPHKRHTETNVLINEIGQNTKMTQLCNIYRAQKFRERSEARPQGQEKRQEAESWGSCKYKQGQHPGSSLHPEPVCPLPHYKMHRKESAHCVEGTAQQKMLT